jgi:S-formylglutathione hydrolase
VLEVRALETTSVPSPVPYALLRPDAAAAGLPVLLWLHGGGANHEFLERTRPIFEQLWARGELPPMVVATPSAGGSFYLDTADGSARWERFVLDELLPEVRSVAAASSEPAATAIAGVSMGGLGSLRMAFRRPECFAAVVALEPGIEPTEHWREVRLRDRVYRPAALLASLYGDPIDAEHFRRNHPLDLIARNGPAIAASRIAIFVECGDEDRLHLFHGAHALHRRLFERRIAHEFRLVRGGDHVGPSLARRIADALRFVGSALRPEPPPPSPELDLLRTMIGALERTSGWRFARTVDGPGGAISVDVVGDGPAVVLLPRPTAR